MQFDAPISKFVYMPHRISYGETDAMGVLYHAEYLHICERSRSYIGREIGFNYCDMERDGFYLPVREAEIRYRAPAIYDDLIYVRVGVSQWKKASVRFVYHIYKEDKTTLIAEATTLHACISKAGKVTPFPAWVKEKFFDQVDEVL